MRPTVRQARIDMIGSIVVLLLTLLAVVWATLHNAPGLTFIAWLFAAFAGLSVIASLRSWYSTPAPILILGPDSLWYNNRVGHIPYSQVGLVVSWLTTDVEDDPLTCLAIVPRHALAAVYDAPRPGQSCAAFSVSGAPPELAPYVIRFDTHRKQYTLTLDELSTELARRAPGARIEHLGWAQPMLGPPIWPSRPPQFGV